MIITENIMRLADNIFILQDGTIALAGSFTNLIQSQDYVSKLGLSLSVDKAPDEVVERPKIVHQAPCDSDEVHDMTDKLLTDVRRKNGDASVYKYYLASSGYFIVDLHLAFMTAWIFCSEFSSKSAGLPENPCLTY